MNDERFESFEQFWPHYVREHSKKSTRRLHFAGTSAALVALAAGLTSRRRRWLVLIAPLLGYGPAWIGHFFFEGNVPATFRHPLWSLRADFVMLAKMIDGTMDDEVARATAGSNGASERANGGTVHIDATVAGAPSPDPSLN
jgi:hypothetical protein